MTYKTGEDLVTEAKQRIRELTPQEVLEMQQRNANVIYLDVREPNEWNLGHLPDAMHLPRGNLESNIEARVDRRRELRERHHPEREMRPRHAHHHDGGSRTCDPYSHFERFA